MGANQSYENISRDEKCKAIAKDIFNSVNPHHNGTIKFDKKIKEKIKKYSKIDKKGGNLTFDEMVDDIKGWKNNIINSQYKIVMKKWPEVNVVILMIGAPTVKNLNEEH